MWAWLAQWAGSHFHIITARLWQGMENVGPLAGTHFTLVMDIETGGLRQTETRASHGVLPIHTHQYVEISAWEEIVENGNSTYGQWGLRRSWERGSCTLRRSVAHLGNHLSEILHLSLNHAEVNLQLQSKFWYFIPALYTHGLKNGHQLRNGQKTNCSRRKRTGVRVRINVHRKGEIRSYIEEFCFLCSGNSNIEKLYHWERDQEITFYV